MRSGRRRRRAADSPPSSTPTAGGCRGRSGSGPGLGHVTHVFGHRRHGWGLRLVRDPGLSSRTRSPHRHLRLEHGGLRRDHPARSTSTACTCRPPPLSARRDGMWTPWLLARCHRSRPVRRAGRRRCARERALTNWTCSGAWHIVRPMPARCGAHVSREMRARFSNVRPQTSTETRSTKHERESARFLVVRFVIERAASDVLRRFG